MRDVQRILDASFNRAREGLRVMEDVARFVLDDESLCARLKQARHDLCETTAQLAGGVSGLQSHRDTAGDVGTEVSTASEKSRAGVRDVALAASRRVTESLRSMEEWSKTLKSVDGAQGVEQENSSSPHPSSLRDATLSQGERGCAAAHFEALRYRVYDLERDLIAALGAGRVGFTGWRLCVLMTESLCVHHDWLTVAKLAMEGGADCVQLREKEVADRELLLRARKLVELAHVHGASVVINDRVDVAMLAGAAGVHVGQGDVSVRDIRRLAGEDLLIGVSASTMDQAIAARRDGADVCGVGAMFSTTTKQKDVIAGPKWLRDYLSVKPALPSALAIGGINESNIGELIEASGGRSFGVAVSSCVCGAADPAAVCHALREAMSAAGAPS